MNHCSLLLLYSNILQLAAWHSLWVVHLLRRPFLTFSRFLYQLYPLPIDVFQPTAPPHRSNVSTPKAFATSVTSSRGTSQASGLRTQRPARPRRRWVKEASWNGGAAAWWPEQGKSTLVNVPSMLDSNVHNPTVGRGPRKPMTANPTMCPGHVCHADEIYYVFATAETWVVPTADARAGGDDPRRRIAVYRVRADG